MLSQTFRRAGIAAALLVVSHAFASPSGVVISGFEVRGPAGGNDEYVELRNTSTGNVNISGWKLQGCASGTPGTPSTRATVNAGITLLPGQYYLFTNSSATGGYSGSVVGDATYGTGITDFAANNFAGIQLLDVGNSRQDGVGSPQSPCREGSGIVTPTANSANNSYARTQDSENNAADFAGPQAGNPHNSGGNVAVCPNEGTRIFTIQGRGHVSPFNAQCVSKVPGIVTQIVSNGFFMQDGDGDGDVATSDGIFVFTATAPSVLVGQQVTVDGTVEEFRPGSSFGATNCPASSGACNLTITEITRPTVSIASGLFAHSLVAPVAIGAGGHVPPKAVIDNDTAGSVEIAAQTSYDPSQDGIDFYESLEGMLVQVNNARVVGPTNRFGEIWVIGDAGEGATGKNARGGITLVERTTGIDFNPERVLVDVSGLTAAAPQANVGDSSVLITGALTYDFGNFRILPSALPQFMSRELPRTTSTVAFGPDRLRIASYNVENLDPNDGDTCDGVPDRDIADGRFVRAAAQIVTYLVSPDVIGLEEVQDNSGCVNDGTVDSTLTLETLVQAIVAAGGPAYSYTLVNPADGQDGGIPGGNIRQAILFNPARIGLVPGTIGPGSANSATSASLDARGRLQLSYSPGRIDPTNPAWTTSRKPLATTFDFNGRRVLVIVNHFNSKGGDEPLFGRFQPPLLQSEVQRLQQAAVEHSFVEEVLALDANARVVTLGDFNDFEFSAPLRVLTGANKGKPILTDLASVLLPPEERYSYVFEGNSQELDHIYVTANLLPDAQMQAVHVNAEFADQVSDHDPLIASLRIAGAPTFVLRVVPGVLNLRVGGPITAVLTAAPGYDLRDFTVSDVRLAGVTAVSTAVTGDGTSIVATFSRASLGAIPAGDTVLLEATGTLSSGNSKDTFTAGFIARVLR